jgi:N utilization substance protein B
VQRRRAREAALQMLYAWELTQTPPDELAASFWQIADLDEAPLSRVGRLFAERLFRGTVERVAQIDPVIEAHAQNWRLSRMAVMDRLILRLAVFELAHDRENPPNVVIDQALELARIFSEADAIRFINGVIDAIQHTLTGQTR